MKQSSIFVVITIAGSPRIILGLPRRLRLLAITSFTMTRFCMLSTLYANAPTLPLSLRGGAAFSRDCECNEAGGGNEAIHAIVTMKGVVSLV